jgi:hypothetical protein
MEPTRDEITSIESMLLEAVPKDPEPVSTAGDVALAVEEVMEPPVEPPAAPIIDAPATPAKKMKKSELIKAIQEASTYVGRECDAPKLTQRKATELRENLNAINKLVDEKKKLIASIKKLIESGVKCDTPNPENLSLDDVKQVLAKMMNLGAAKATNMPDPGMLLSCDPGEFLYRINVGVCQGLEQIAARSGFPYLLGWAAELKEQHEILREALAEIYRENAEWLAPLMSATSRWAMIMFFSATTVMAKNYALQSLTHGPARFPSGPPSLGGRSCDGPSEHRETKTQEDDGAGIGH